MTKRMFVAVGLATLAVALARCASLAPLLNANLARPTLAYESWEPKEISLDGVTVELHYQLHNPNPFALDIARLAYALEVEGQHVASGNLPAGLQVAANGSAPLPIAVRLRFADVPSFVQNVFGKEAVGYRVSGTVGVDSPIGPIDLPFEHADHTSVPQLPAFSLQSIRMTRARLGELGLAVKLRVHNSNAFSLPLGTLQYGLSIGGAEVAHLNSAALSTIGPQAQGELELPVTVNLSQARRVGAQALQGGRMDASLQGNALYGPLSIPIQLSGKVPVAR